VLVRVYYCYYSVGTLCCKGILCTNISVHLSLSLSHTHTHTHTQTHRAQGGVFQETGVM